MYLRMAKRMLLETDKRLLWKLFWNMGIKGLSSVQKHKKRLRNGQFRFRSGPFDSDTARSDSDTAVSGSKIIVSLIKL